MSDSSVPNPCSEISAELDLSELLENLNISNKPNSDDLSSNLSSNLSEDIYIMAPPTFDIKNLCILPNFDGNPKELYDFIKVATTLLNYYYDSTSVASIQNVLLLQGILSKLTGRAKEVVSIYGYERWDDIKKILIQNFGDQRNENSLTRDLVNLRQHPGETPIQFYEKCMGLLNTICNHVELHNDTAVIIQSKKDFFYKQTLTTFLAGLREPLGSTIRAMRPQNLAIAIQYIQEENNIRYLQRSHAPPPTLVHKRIPPVQLQQGTPRFMQNPGPTWQAPQVQRPQFPQGPINITPRVNPPQQRFFTNQQVFGKPQNVWKPQGAPQPKPVPMSTTTRNTFGNQQTTNFKNQNPQTRQAKPTFTSEELFNIEQQEPVYGGPSCSYACHQEYEYYPEMTATEEYTEGQSEETFEEQNVNFCQDMDPTSDI